MQDVTEMVGDCTPKTGKKVLITMGGKMHIERVKRDKRV